MERLGLLSLLGDRAAFQMIAPSGFVEPVFEDRLGLGLGFANPRFRKDLYGLQPPSPSRQAPAALASPGRI